MDFNDCVLITAGSDKLIRVYDIRNPTQPVDTKETTLKHQVRCVSLFPDAKGYAVGSIEGRVQIQYISQNDGFSIVCVCVCVCVSVCCFSFFFWMCDFALLASDNCEIA